MRGNNVKTSLSEMVSFGPSSWSPHSPVSKANPLGRSGITVPPVSLTCVSTRPSGLWAAGARYLILVQESNVIRSIQRTGLLLVDGFQYLTGAWLTTSDDASESVVTPQRWVLRLETTPEELMVPTTRQPLDVVAA